MGLPKQVDFVEDVIAELKLSQGERIDGEDEAPHVSSCIIADIDELYIFYLVLTY